MPVRQFEPSLRLSIAVMILLATMLLGIGDRSAALTLISCCVLAVSMYLTDVTRRFHLNQSQANWIALAIVVITGVHIAQIDRQGKMIAVANLQSYLQYVLLFQPKTSRVYWQLALLSLGQVAIASTLVPGPTFGMILLAYFLAATLSFVLLVMDFDASRLFASASRLELVATHASPSGAARRAPRLRGRSLPYSHALGWGLLAQAISIGCASVLVTSILFFFLPRWDIPNQQTESSAPIRTVGFSKKVTLGELGEVVNDASQVMRIQFLRPNSGRPFKLQNELLLRGTVVTHYQNGAWTQSSVDRHERLAPQERTPFVRQHLWAEPSDDDEVFCVFPAFVEREEPRLFSDSQGEEIVRQGHLRTQMVELEICTTGIRDERQADLIPCERRSRRALLRMPGANDGQDDPFLGLRELAASILREADIDPRNHLAAARKLNEYLHASGRFFYSLEAQSRDPALDPLEDFVMQHRVGHCEYFAGALVMLLRSQNIPARMAIGYKGGEWNSPGMYYQIQQLHAHTWVEVYLDGENLPADAFHAEEERPSAAWLVLDPTDGVQEGAVAADDVGLLARGMQYIDYGRVLWTNYVASLTAKRQQQAIYEPLAQGISATTESLFGPKVWRARFQAIADSPFGTFWAWYRRHWFSWRGGLVAIGFSLVVVAGYRAVLWALRTLRQSGAGKSRFHDDVPVLEMYRRLEAALEHHGMARQPHQTAHEFAVAAGGDLAESLEFQRLAPLPRRIVEAFYRVRFGGRTLDNQEADAVEHALVELELALARPR